MATLAPEALKYLYNNANANDSFICGVSGMGYINPTAFPRRLLSSFAGMTAEAMGRADLSALAVLDNDTTTRPLSTDSAGRRKNMPTRTASRADSCRSGTDIASLMAG